MAETPARLDLTRYVPYFLTAVGNALSRGASRLYLREFGVGIGEWRVMSLLAIEPGIMANRICQVISLDKAAASRSLKELERQALVDAAATADPRRRTYTLTARGLALHDRIIRVALQREARVLAGIDDADLEVLVRCLRRMNDNMADVNRAAYDIPPETPPAS
jgi:DNA-binding MarR family transcriptional regulator